MSDEANENVLNELTALRELNSKRAKFSIGGLVAVFALSLMFFLFSSVFTSTSKGSVDTLSLEKSAKNELEKLSVSAGETLAALQWYEKERSSKYERKKPDNLLPEAQLKERYETISAQKTSLLKEL